MLLLQIHLLNCVVNSKYSFRANSGKMLLMQCCDYKLCVYEMVSVFKILFEMLIWLCVSGCFSSVWICCWEDVYVGCWVEGLHCLLPHRDLWMCVSALSLWVTALQRRVEREPSQSVSAHTCSCILKWLHSCADTFKLVFVCVYRFWLQYRTSWSSSHLLWNKTARLAWG